MLTIAKNNHGATRFAPRTYTDLMDIFFDVPFSNFNKNIPTTDVSEDDHAHYVHVSLPGLKKEDIKIEVKENVLTISGEKKLQKEENSNKKYHFVENYYGSFYRSFRMPENVNVEAIEASYTDGILEIKIPKDETKKASTVINIK